MADEDRRLQARLENRVMEGVDHRHEPALRQCGRAAVAGKVERDRMPARGERVEHRVPHATVEGESVEEHERGAGRLTVAALPSGEAGPADPGEVEGGEGFCRSSPPASATRRSRRSQASATGSPGSTPPGSSADALYPTPPASSTPSARGLAAMGLRSLLPDREEERIWRDALTTLVRGFSIPHR